MQVGADPPSAICSSSNTLITALPPPVRAELLASCRGMPMQSGKAVSEGEAQLVFFPETTILSLVDSRGMELGLVGREGMTGWSILLGSMTHGIRCMAELNGTSLALPLAELTRLCRASPPIRAMVLQFVEVAAAQMIGAISAATHHGLTARLARRLLMMHDRGSGDSYHITHSRLAEALAVRRASVTDRLHLLEGERVLRCTRNRVTILDRTALLAVAGGAYGETEQPHLGIMNSVG
ncbi:Crp/Fnr family transcriptional regulator [Sphingomonas sp. S2-65]|uniref:Crp/Fnr family transcriptional regulator n=1 Tax=Sphingomonas sp. S2-65 TaxID=2903960 RepID=UPI001F1B7E5F|nr:Crp/Fnr family transcriptional regulator [Sphingomonas sp. S2-65]UYY58929.1 Crp/Fnr family transcriptional regulator [Sphingomonas sp. S2-65]